MSKINTILTALKIDCIMENIALPSVLLLDEFWGKIWMDHAVGKLQNETKLQPITT